MGFFKRWREKRKNNQKAKELKRPDSSYDIYNQSETLTLKTDMNQDMLVAYDNIGETKTSKSSSSTRTTSTKTTQLKDEGENMSKESRNIYYVSARKDKNGKKLGWEVKKEKADRVTKICDTKEEAIQFVKEKAGNQGSTCIIRKLDGSIDKTIKFNDNK